MAVGLQLQLALPGNRCLLLCISLHVHFQTLMTSETKLRFCMQLIFLILFKGNKNIFKETLAPLKFHKAIAWIEKLIQECKGLKINSIC